MIQFSLIIDINNQPVGLKCQINDCNEVMVLFPDVELRQFLNEVAVHLRKDHMEMAKTADVMALKLHKSKEIMALEINDVPISGYRDSLN